MDMPYRAKLASCREFLEDYFPDFPHGRCQYASKLVAHVAGLESVAGYHKGPSRKDWHAWNYDAQNKVYVDISLDQYGFTLEPISILSKSTPQIEKDLVQTIQHRDGVGLLEVPEFDEILEAYHDFIE